MGTDFQKLKQSRYIEDLLKFSIINLNKPSGPTSFTVSDFIRKFLNLNKTSHAGTLDPAVSGVLPILLGRACRLSDFFMHKDKTYVGIMRLHKEIQQEKLERAIKKFIGKIRQLPPVRSSVKREIREREVKSFDILEIKGKDILFQTEVQAGTYIRRICDDIGKEISGAHMLELRRINAGIFSELDPEFINLYEFEKAVQQYKEGSDVLLRSYLIPAEEALSKVMPSVQLPPTTNHKQLLTGKPLMLHDLPSLPEKEVFAVFNNETLIGIYKKSAEGSIIARPLFVLNYRQFC